MIAFGFSSKPGARSARRKWCLQVKLVFLAGDKLGGFFFNPRPHENTTTFQLLSFLPSSHLPLSLSARAASRLPHLCLCSGYPFFFLFFIYFFFLNKEKDSRCGAPLLLNQLPHQCIILANFTSPPTQSFSLPTTLTPSPPPTPSFSLVFSSRSFIPAVPLGSVAHQLQQRQTASYSRSQRQ